MVKQSTIGARIKRARKEAGLDQKSLAAILSVNPVSVSRWETNYRTPDVETLEKIASATSVSVSALITDHEPEGVS